MRTQPDKLIYSWAGLLLLAGCASSSLPLSVSVISSAQAVDQGVNTTFKATVTNDSISRGVKWSLNGPGSLQPPTGPSATYYPPTAALSTPLQVTVTATSVADPTKSASVPVTVNPDPVLFSQTLATATVGVPYTQPIVLNGGTAPFQWIVYNGPVLAGHVAGSVPDGLSLNPATGLVSGTPTAAGTWYFETYLTDADAYSAFCVVTLQVNPAPAAAANPVPFLNQPLVPAAAAPGSAATTLRVSGSGFASGATVDFNGTPLTTVFLDGGHLSALLPAAQLTTARTASITVVNPSPGGGASNVVFFQVAAAQSSVLFTSAPGSPMQFPDTNALAIADLNGDGKPDLAIAANVRLYAMLGNGDGTFSAAPGSPNFMPSPPYDDFASPYVGSLAVGDFNHSGHPGLAVEEFTNETTVIFLGDGTGALAPSSAAFVQSIDPTQINAADFNGDGNLDLALIGDFGYPTTIALGYGKGAFTPIANLPIQGFASGGATGDFNGDGKLDFAIAGTGSSATPASGFTISLGNGDGTFTPAPGVPLTLGQTPYAILAADFNGDGKLDLAITDTSNNKVLILLGKGDGTFQPPVALPVGLQPQAIVAGDFNNDGKLDLAIANNGSDTVTLLLGNGDGTFTQASGSPYLVSGGPSAIVAADFNGDGKLDLAVAIGQSAVAILLQH